MKLSAVLTLLKSQYGNKITDLRVLHTETVQGQQKTTYYFNVHLEGVVQSHTLTLTDTVNLHTNEESKQFKPMRRTMLEDLMSAPIAIVGINALTTEV